MRRTKSIYKALKDYYGAVDFLHGFARQMRKDNPDVLLLGDSVLTANDDNAVGEVALLDLFLRDCAWNCLALVNNSGSALLYRHVLDILPDSSEDRGVAIVEINMRSFSDEWYLRPEYNFFHSHFVLDWYLGKINFLDSFREYYDLGLGGGLRQKIKEYHEAVSPMSIARENNRIGEIFDFCEKRKDAIYPFYYGYGGEYIDERISPLCDMLHLLKRKGFIPAAYITPLPYERLAGEYRERMAGNIGNVVEKVRNCEGAVEDFSHFLMIWPPLPVASTLPSTPGALSARSCLLFSKGLSKKVDSNRDRRP